MTSRAYLFFWITFYLIVLFVAYQVKHTGFEVPDAAIVLDQAHFESLSLDKDGFQSRPLPDNWQWHGDRSDQGYYRLTFSASPKPKEVWAILIPTVRSNLRVSLNGVVVGQGGSMDAPVSSNLRRPMFFAIAPALFRDQGNQILVEVKSSVPGKGFLDKVVVGPYSVLKPAFDRLNFFRISIVQAITYALIVMAALMTLLAVMRPANSEYRWFALSTSLWAMHNSTNHINDVIWSNHFWDWFSYSTLGWFALVTPIVLLRFRERHHPRVERIILFLSLSIPAVMFFLPQTLMHQVADYGWYPIAFGVGGAALVLVFHDAWKTRNVEFQLLAASGLFIIPYALHDILLVHAVLPWEDGYYIQFGAIILLAVFAVILLTRLVKYNNEAEKLNHTLHDDVAKKTTQIKEALQYTHSLEKKEWLNAERARITRDMHDGVAGQIVSTISGLQKGQLSDADIQRQLEYCINDLRLMIDSLDNEDNDLVALLGMFRYRVSTMLKLAAIELSWLPLPASTKIELTPSVSLHLLRILQEAVHNVIRHSNSQSISISAQIGSKDKAHVLLKVRDTGVGLPEIFNFQANQLFTQKSRSEKAANAGPKVHRGLENMRYRAEKIDASLSISSDSSGTEVALVLPVTILAY